MSVDDISVDDNKAVVRELVEGWNRLDRRVFTRLVHPALHEEALQHSDELVAAFSVRDGQVVETWAMQDRLGLFQQLDLVPAVDDLVHWADAEAG